MVDGKVSKSGLERTKALAAIFSKNLLVCQAGQSAIDSDKVCHFRTTLKTGHLARHVAQRVGLRLLDLARNRVGIVDQVDAGILRRVGLRHFLRAVLEGHDPRARPFGQGFWQRKEAGGTIIAVEAVSDIAGKFQVLALVFAHWDMRCLVREDVSSLQDRIIKQPDG